MPLFGWGDEAANHFKLGKRYGNPSWEGFDLDLAIQHLAEAESLKPHNEQYRRELDEMRDVRRKCRDKFLMEVEDVFGIRGRGTVVTGKVERGTLRPGDQVVITGHKGTRTAVVEDIQSFRRRVGQAIPGQSVGLLLRHLESDDIERGDTMQCE